MKYTVLSPDNITISLDTYKSVRAAKQALKEWITGYERQGYYSSNEGRIDLEDIAAFCTIKPLK